MPKKLLLLSAVMVAVTALPVADAGDYSAALGLDAFEVQMAGTSLVIPSVMVRGHARFGHFLLGTTINYGVKSSTKLMVGSIHTQYLMPWGTPRSRWTLNPEFGLGYLALQGASAGSTTAMYADLGLNASLAITPSLGLFGRAMAGTDLGLQLAGRSMQGGLTYSGLAGVDYRIGMGRINVGYQYQHLPFGSESMTMSQYQLSYSLQF